MPSNDLRLLDCTLRDGGYINDWRWGFHCAKAIVRCLNRANLDFVEVGFLKDVKEYDEDVTVCNSIEQLNRLIPDAPSDTCYTAMTMNGAYDISKLSPYTGTGIKMIRVTAHDYDIDEGLELASKIKRLGYMVSINPINIMGYTDEQIIQIINKVNEILPYQFSIVDTFGSMKRKDLSRIISITDNNLAKDIRLGLHLHENMSLSCSLAQQFVDMHLNRPIALDGSLYGMGRIPGNLPIELIADYVNEYSEKKYDIDYLLDAIQDYIEPIKGTSKWGYTPAYFLSARYNLHRNYAEFYMSKGDLSNKDISHILASFDKSKASVFDEEYAKERYSQYKNNNYDDLETLEDLKRKLEGKDILILAPGASLLTQEEKIKEYIDNNRLCIISVNFVPESIECNYAFFSNGKRFAQAPDNKCDLILTSNIDSEVEAYRVNYNRLSGAFKQGYNSMIMAMKLLTELGINKCAVAGADGYSEGKRQYYKSSFRRMSEDGRNYNYEVKEAIHMLNMNVFFVTDSAYEDK